MTSLIKRKAKQLWGQLLIQIIQRFSLGLFKGTEPTKYIQLAYMTGILPIKKQKTQSALNNFKDYSMLYAGPLASYIGFTEDDVITYFIHLGYLVYDQGFKTAVPNRGNQTGAC